MRGITCRRVAARPEPGGPGPVSVGLEGDVTPGSAAGGGGGAVAGTAGRQRPMGGHGGDDGGTAGARGSAEEQSVGMTSEAGGDVNTVVVQVD